MSRNSRYADRIKAFKMDAASCDAQSVASCKYPLMGREIKYVVAFEFF
jgi:hypothetical protein